LMIESVRSMPMRINSSSLFKVAGLIAAAHDSYKASEVKIELIRRMKRCSMPLSKCS
jgi:hypothetical protein